MPKKKDNMQYKDLILKKYFYKDITKAENKSLDNILKKSLDAKKYRDKLIKKINILDEIPVIKTSKNFEESLFSKLNIKQKNNTGWYERLFGVQGSMSFAAASVPLLIASWIILRGFLIPSYKQIPAHDNNRIKLKTEGNVLDRKISKKINHYLLKSSDSPGSIKTETKITYKNIRLIKKGKESPPTAMKSKARRVSKSKTKLLTHLKEKKKTSSTIKDSFSGKIRMRGKARSIEDKKVKNDKSKVLKKSVQKQQVSKKKNQVYKSLERMVGEVKKPKVKKLLINRDEESKSSGLKYFKKEKKDDKKLLSIINKTVPDEAKVNILLSQPASSNHLYSRIKKIKKVIKPLLPSDVKISLKFEVSKSESDRSIPKKDTGIPMILLWIFIELLIRIWLVYDLKKRSAGKGQYVISILLGSFFIPVYIFLRRY